MHSFNFFLLLAMCLFTLGCKSQTIVINESNTPFSSEFVVFNAEKEVTHDIIEIVKRISPSQKQIGSANEILIANVPADIYEKIRAKHWKRQYFGYINRKGEEILYLNLLNFKNNKKSKKYFSEWNTEFIIGYGDFFEKNTFRFLINLATEEIEIY